MILMFWAAIALPMLIFKLKPDTICPVIGLLIKLKKPTVMTIQIGSRES